MGERPEERAVGRRVFTQQVDVRPRETLIIIVNVTSGTTPLLVRPRKAQVTSLEKIMKVEVPKYLRDIYPQAVGL